MAVFITQLEGSPRRGPVRLRTCCSVQSFRGPASEKEAMAKGDVVLDLELALFVLQKKDWMTLEWVTQGKHTYRGKTDSHLALEKVRKANPEEEWRTLLKQEAERYREGWKDCAEFVRVAHGLEIEDEGFSTSSVVPDTGHPDHKSGNPEPSAPNRKK